MRTPHPALLLAGVLLVGGLHVSNADGARVEWIPADPLSADFDGDGVVAFADFLRFVSGYNGRVGDPSFDDRLDLDADGSVGFADFLLFVSCYGGAGGPLPAVEESYAVYVADVYDRSVVVLDFDTHLMLDYLPFRGPIGIRINQAQALVYVSDQFGLYALDTDHLVQFSVPTDSEGRLVLSADERYAYVTEAQNDLVRVVDLVSQATVDTFLVGELPTDVDLTPDGKLLCVTSTRSQDVHLLNLETGETVARVDLGARPGELVLMGDGTRAYVANQSQPAVLVIDVSRGEIIGEIALDSPCLGAAASPDGRVLYVGSAGSLVAIDAERNLVSKTLQIAEDTAALGVSPDGSRAYVGSMQSQAGGAGLTVVDLRRWQVMGRIRGIAYPGDIRFRTRVTRKNVE